MRLGMWQSGAVVPGIMQQHVGGNPGPLSVGRDAFGPSAQGALQPDPTARTIQNAEDMPCIVHSRCLSRGARRPMLHERIRERQSE
jgi:hypothetical protein